MSLVYCGERRELQVQLNPTLLKLGLELLQWSVSPRKHVGVTRISEHHLRNLGDRP